MNKKILLGSIVMGLSFVSVSFTNANKVTFGDDTINFDVDAIQALSHRNGETVNFVNSYIKQYWDGSAIDLVTLKTLYEMNSDIESFAKHTYDKDYMRNLYATWDDFKPVNNTLTWKSNVNATSYDVVVALNDELTETIVEEKDLIETNYTLINPYSNTHYYWQVTAHTKNGDVKSSLFDFYSGSYKRTVDIPSVSNTRDVGGFTGQFGTMKEGLIYRSARLDDVDPTGVSALRTLDIQTDLDIRDIGEGATNPAALNNYYLRTMQMYSKALREEYRSATVEAVRIFTDPNNYPIDFHCAVGRDRTGTLAMILQSLAGASKEYIIHDYYTSMWSVTGAYQKSNADMNLSEVNNVLNGLTENGKYSLADGAENFLKVREDTITHEQVGLTDEEIAAIRDIWSGKTTVEHAPKTFKASENYEGKAFVKIKAVGHKDTAMMVKKGTIVAAPYELSEDYAWYVNGATFNFATPINSATFIYADVVIQFTVSIHFIGLSKQDETVKGKTGEVITFTKYETDGYDMLVLLDNGKEISKFEIVRDACINIIYFKK